MKTNLNYYPRRTDAHRHPKFKILRAEYGNGTDGWAAEGRFWALNDFIAESDECKLDLTKKRNKGVVADELGMSISDFDYFIRILKSPDVELIVEIDPDIYTTKKVEEAFQTTQVERVKAREKYHKKEKSDFSPENNKTSPEKIESSGEAGYKLKETKLNKTKVKETKEVVVLAESAAAAFPEFNLEQEEKYVPDFSNPEEIELCTRRLFKRYCNKDQPDQRADLKPIIEFINDPRPEMTKDICFSVVLNSFLILHQANRTDTGYLIGIIRKKMIEKREELLRAAKKNNIDSNKNFADKLAKEEEYKRNRIAQMAKLKEFYDKNPGLFTSQEKYELNKAFAEDQWFTVLFYIEPKMEAITL